MQFHYKMRLDFSNPVMEHHFTLKCLPQTNFRQETGIWLFLMEKMHWTAGSTRGFLSPKVAFWYRRTRELLLR